MSEQSQVIRGINWRETFPVTHLFRTFRIAIHPSKLCLALIALVVLYVGGRCLDAIWGRLVPSYCAVPGEIAAFEATPTSKAFDQWRKQTRTEYARAYANRLMSVAALKVDSNGKRTDEMPGVEKYDKAIEAAEAGLYTGDVRYWARNVRSAAIDRARARHKEQVEALDKANKQDTDENKKAYAKTLEAIDKDLDGSIRQAYAQARQDFQTVDFIKGQGLFDTFFHYQASQLGNVTNSVLAGNWLGGISGQGARPGVILSLVRFVTVGPGWAITHHTVYFIIYGALFLCVWSLCGGAIARIAAVHVADEGRKLSFRQGMEFSIHKFLSFISAPLIPLLIIVGIGAFIAVVGGILMLIPYIGEILVGAALILALVGGFVITLVILGTAGGLNLMYPTIAVEGSDSFDAISRSFSYVYARPWRMIFYTLVGIAYGSLCYLFARLVIWLILLSTHFFVGLLVFRSTNDGLGNLWTTIWATPTLGSFSSPVDTEALTWAGSTAAFLVHIWVYLVVAVLGAFLISFYFSMNTIIYYLLRKEVDATEMDDVFLEETEEDFVDRPAAAAAETTVPTTTPAEPTASTAAAETSPASTQAPPATDAPSESAPSDSSEPPSDNPNPS